MAWLFQDTRQKKKLGDACPWSVGWIDPETGKTRSKKVGTENAATKYARKLEGQIAVGTYEPKSRITWREFRERYEKTVLARKPGRTIEGEKIAFEHFERIVKPGRLAGIKTVTIKQYTAKRLKEKHNKRALSPGTVNKELRVLRQVLRRAVKWELIPRAPDFELLKEDRPLPKIMPDQDFSKLYRHTRAAQYPDHLPVAAADWWQALLIFCRFTGWRIGEVLSLRWEDVDLEPDANGHYWATTQADDNKGGRTERVALPKIVVDHLRKVRTFSPLVFPWRRTRRRLYDDLDRIATAAGVTFPHNGRRHDKFHCLRKTCGTRAAMAGIAPKALMGLMRHRNMSTTERYYLDAEAMQAEAVDLVPVSEEVLQAVS